jgi:ATP-dependent RNA helicase DeaD
MEQNRFSSLPVHEQILQAVQEMGFQEMTEIQAKAIPPMLEGRDVIAKAPTGTGKTCAFGIPLIQRIDPENPEIQAIILAPTRELATQIRDDLEALTRFLPQVRTLVVYGGQSMEKQKQQLKKGAHILVATPGRLLDLMQHRYLSLKSVSAAVLDEADKMLDMGFYKDVRKILDSLKGLKQMCMFSATISREVMDIGWLYQRDPEEITVLPLEDSEPKIDQYSIQCIGREKIEIILRLMKQFSVSRAIIFCNTKYTTGMVSEQLHAQGLNTACLHGDMRQSERNKIMEQYKDGKIDILVATDVAARGIDVSDIQVVFNYDIPQENDAYLHRIGRTGRAKKEGISFVLHSKDEQRRLDNIIRYTRSNILPLEMDGWGVFQEKK